MLRPFQRRRLPLVLGVWCFYFLLVAGLQMNLRSKGNASFKSSPAAVAIQDGNTVRKVLKNRSTRGRSSYPVAIAAKESEKSEKRHERGVKVEKTSSGGKAAKGISIAYSLTIQALKVYHKEHSDLIMPRRLIVPENEDYPKELQGFDLAGTVYSMKWWQRHVNERPERVAELNELGFVWERLQPEWNLVLEGLMVYGALNGNLLVPSKFVIPYEKSWPKATWGLALGNCVYRIRNRGDYLQGCNAWSRRDQLDAIGFVWDTREHKFNTFCRALRLYSELEARDNGYNRVSALRVPSQYVIPYDDDTWPKDTWGYRLGEKCTAVRQKELYVKGHPERLRTLAELGFHSGGNDSLSWLEVVHASAVFSQMNKRKLDVPASFVVPAPPKVVQNREGSLDNSVVGSNDAWPWPEYLWGFPLGQRLKNIRLKGYYMRGKEANARRSQLDALGFVWEPKRGRPRKS